MTRDKGHTVYIVDGARTPFLKARGAPGPFTASDLAVQAGRPLLSRMPFDPSDLDEVIIGCVIPGPDEANIARVVSLRLGCGKSVPAWTVQRNCASGLQALDAAMANISSGRADLILAGGTESMSHAPIQHNIQMVEWLAGWYKAKSVFKKVSHLARLRPAHLRPVISLLRGLSDPIVGLSMGQTAEELAYRFGVTRLEMDEYAVESHRRLARAMDAGDLNEIETSFDTKGLFYDHDDGLRRDGDVTKLGALRPVFDRVGGSVTAGNSAQITDGAALLVLASKEAIERYRLPVLARIRDVNWAGLDPTVMGLGPVYSSTPLLTENGLTIKDIDYWEINEAFACQVLACLRAWKDESFCKDELGLGGPFGEIDGARLNVDGGGVSLGHPVGASGARIVLHLARVLEREGARRGIATLCIGGGQGGAALIERDGERDGTKDDPKADSKADL